MDLLFRALDILEYITLNGSASSEDVAENLGIPKSTVYRLLSALRERDYVRRTSANCFEPGPRLLMLQGITERQNRLLQIARPHLRQLCKATEQTAHLAVMSKNQLGYIDSVIGESGLSIYPSPSSPLHCTSLGKVLLAFLPELSMQEKLGELELEQRTPNTLTSREALLEDLRQVRARGYALDNEEFRVGVRCIGAPVRNAAGEVIAAISISGLASTIGGDLFPTLVSTTCETALSISKDLGYEDTSPKRGNFTLT